MRRIAHLALALIAAAARAGTHVVVLRSAAEVERFVATLPVPAPSRERGRGTRE